MDSWRAARVPSLPGRGTRPRVWDSSRAEPRLVGQGEEATVYACGITPYDATHLGHAATYVAVDLLVRALRDAGQRVSYVQNITDVDDPLLERADRDGEDWRELATRETTQFRADMEALRVLPPGRLVGAVEALPLIDEFTRQLASRGALYELDGDVYFSRGADPEFGTVARLTAAEMTALSAERGGDPERPGKKDPLDGLVWRAKRPGEPAWESSAGPGRPGWHVECAAIATRYLGAAFDVQAGGSDLLFPHHEMCASHARVAFADPDAFARHYLHAGMVRLDGEKMSKSQGNLVFVSALLAGGADPMAVRLAILSHHYRSDWDWAAAGLAEAVTRLARWRAVAAERPGERPRAPAGAPPAEAPAVVSELRERLAADLDAPGALAAVDRWADAGATAPPGPGEAAAVRAALDALLGVTV